MSETEVHRRRGRRLLLVAAPFAAGAAVGAGVLAGVGGTGTTASQPSTAATQPAAVARSTSGFDAETIYERDSPGVVDITVTTRDTSQGVSPFGPGQGSQEAQAEGTGFVYDEAGHIVTAAHVVSGATAISVKFSDGTTATATLVGEDSSTDTAVIKVSVPAAKLTPLALADSAAVDPGQAVVAIGSPFGYSESITAGIVSAVDRAIEAPNGYTISNAIQTDAAINHGNSGGPLIDANGHVVGINVQIAADGQGTSSANAGVGFAVPSNTVKQVANALIAGKAVEHAYLGVSVGDAKEGAGAEIGTVRAGGPAAAAGLKAGDVVTEIDGVEVTDADQLTAAIGDHHPGDKVRLTVSRNGSTVELVATLGTRPAATTS